ncbi:MAG: hypothetical protein AAGF27_06740 [Pseudomonadota bacterium]
MKRIKNKRNNRGRGRLNQSPNVTNEIDMFRTTEPGDAILNRADKQTADYVNVDDDLLHIGNRLSDGRIEIKFRTGDYIYRGLFMLAQCTAATAITQAPAVANGQLTTLGEDGKRYIKPQYFGRYINRVKLVADGITIFDFESYERARAYLMSYNWTIGTQNEAVFWGFGWPNVFQQGSAQEDLFALGTANIRDLKMVLYTSSNWDDSIQLVCPTYYHPQRAKAGHVIYRTQRIKDCATAGVHIIDDIRVDRPIWRIVVTTPEGQKLTNYEVRVGDVVWQTGTPVSNRLETLLLREVSGIQGAVGPYRDHNGDLVDAGCVIDLRVDLMDRDGRVLPPMTSDAQRRRDERLEIEVKTAQPDTEVCVEVFFAGRI